MAVGDIKMNFSHTAVEILSVQFTSIPASRHISLSNNTSGVKAASNPKDIFCIAPEFSITPALFSREMIKAQPFNTVFSGKRRLMIS
ncbi:hypothetical protein D3C73_1357290 [compost metagenome]